MSMAMRMDCDDELHDELAEREARLRQREQKVDEIVQKSQAEQRRAIGILEEVTERLDRLSEEMRKSGAFPVAGQLEREKKRVAEYKSALS